MRWMLSGALCAALLFAQETDGIRVSSRPYVPFGIRADSNLVTVGVVVRDRQGIAVAGLKQTDFRLFDQGAARPVTSFVMESRGGSPKVAETGGGAPPAADTAPAPVAPRSSGPARFIAIYFEDFGTPTSDVLRVRTAAKRFIQDGVAATDRVAIFSSSEGRVTEFTGEKSRLLAAVDHLRAHPKFQDNIVNCPRLTAYDAYAIANRVSEYLIQ